MTATVLAITGTTTDVGKTIVTAALAAAARGRGARVAVCKPAQTGVLPDEPGDLDRIQALAGGCTAVECARYPEPLAPETAARRAGMAPLDTAQVVDTIGGLAAAHDLVLVEGAGGVLVRLAPDKTLLDIAEPCSAPVVVVVPAGLGALNHAELTVAAIRARGLAPAGLIIGSWPETPDLASICNRSDLPRLTGIPVVGVIPTGAGRLEPADFALRASSWIDPDFLRRVVGLVHTHSPGDP